MRSEIREIIRERDNYCCGYCGIREIDAGSKLTVDHIQPRSQGGTDDLENLIYCCHACNSFKGDKWSDDPEYRLLNPRRDNLSEHIKYREDGLLEALTSRGEFHILSLQLNREALIEHRLDIIETTALRERHKAVIAHLDEMELRGMTIQQKLRSILQP